MRIILVVIDGLGDELIPELNNKTPLQAAFTPYFDKMAENGTTGFVLPFFEKGHLPTSEDTHLALFGYEPEKYNPGRGVFEVLGNGMKPKTGDVCLRGNFATINKQGKIIDRRACRIENTETLVKAINNIKIEGVKFIVKKAVAHRIGIIMRCRGLSPKISTGDPKKSGVKPLKILPKESSGKAIFTARVLNEFLEKTHLILKNQPLNKRRKLPANYLLVRGAGSLKNIPSFQEKYGLKAACIAGGALYKGIGKALGMDLINVKGANALPTTNLKGKFLAAKKALGKYGFVFCHIKAVDNLAEDGKYREKKEFIEKIDKNLKPLLGLKDVLVVITGDHATCSLLKRHCLKPVPLIIYGAKKGVLGKIEQIRLMPEILTLIR